MGHLTTKTKTMKQTAVQWLIDNLEKYEDYAKISFRCLGEIEIALELEKEQITDAWHKGYDNQSPMIDEENCGQTYYYETFKQDL